MYLQAVPEAFGRDIDYAMLHKVYGNDPEGQTRYSPAQCLGTSACASLVVPIHDTSAPVTSSDRILI
jgi:hypothetical protein